MLVNNNNLVWIDMEMTGLDPEHCVVLEIASIVTDAQLNVLAEGPVIAIHQPDTILDNMDPWCVETHGNSGLTQRCKDSQASVESASDDTIAFLQQYVDAGASPLCGNSIGQDRRFLVKHMPALEAFFHYRNIDVSSVKELVRRWKPELLEQFTKKGAHLALDDIRESIDEMRFYRQHVFSI